MPRMVFSDEAERLVQGVRDYFSRASSSEEQARALQLSRDYVERELSKAYELGRRHGSGQ